MKGCWLNLQTWPDIQQPIHSFVPIKPTHKSDSKRVDFPLPPARSPTHVRQVRNSTDWDPQGTVCLNLRGRLHKKSVEDLTCGGMHVFPFQMRWPGMSTDHVALWLDEARKENCEPGSVEGIEHVDLVTDMSLPSHHTPKRLRTASPIRKGSTQATHADITQSLQNGNTFR